MFSRITSFSILDEFFISIKRKVLFLKDLFPCEFNFGVFLIVSLCLDSFFQDAKLLIFFCVFSLAILLLNWVGKIFQAFSYNLKFVLIITVYLIVTFFFLPLLTGILPVLILRIQLSFLLLFAFFLFIFLIGAFQVEQVGSFSILIEKCLPAILFSLLIISFSYSIYFFFKLPFLIGFLLLLGFNHIFLWEIFLEEGTPMILRSSFLGNFFRFFLPFSFLEEGFLFFGGTSPFIIAPSIFSLEGKLSNSVVPRRYLTFSEQSALLPRSPITLFNNQFRGISYDSSANYKQAIKNFVTRTLPEILSYNFKGQVPAYSLEAEDSLKNLSTFSPRSVINNRIILMKPHEIIAYSLALDHGPDATAVIFMNLLFPFSENILALAPSETQVCTDIVTILEDYKRFQQPFYFFFKDDGYLGLENTAHSLTKDRAAVLTLITNDPNLCKIRSDFGNVSGALISTNDILILKNDTILSVQAKNRFFGEGLHKNVVYTSQDFSLLTNLAEKKGLLLEHEPQGLIIASKPLSTEILLNKCLHDPKTFSESLSKAEDLARDPSTIQELQKAFAEGLVSEKAALPPKEYRTKFSVFNDSSKNE